MLTASQTGPSHPYDPYNPQQKGSMITMKLNEQLTLRELLASPQFQPIAKYAIFNYDLPAQPFYPKTLAQLHEEHFGGNIIRGLERVSDALAAGECIFPIYSQAECADDPAKKDVHLMWLPSDDPGASDRPYIFLVPGGGFWNVWSLTEGWPVADHFNKRGYHVFILTYRVNGVYQVIPKDMEDFAQAFRFIRAHEAQFGVRWDQYITNGYSAGGYLICLWATKQYGCHAFGLPRPQAMIPVYPFTSWQIKDEKDHFDPDTMDVLGCSYQEAISSGYEIPEHVADFPPCAIFLAADDTLVPPEHSYKLHRALEAAGIPCRLEAGPQGNHGFAEAEGMCMEGWPERALDWIEATVK